MHPLQREAQKLDAAARSHKRLAQQHRAAAKAARQAQAEIEAKLGSLGLKVTQQGEGKGDSHGQDPRSRPADAGRETHHRD